MFSIIAITSTILYVTYSMHVLDNYAQTFLTTNQQKMNTQNEQFKITQLSMSSSKFNITVQNTGQIPINFTRLWVQNTTTTNWVGKYQINSVVSPGSTVSNIGTNLPLTALSTKSYDMKLVTSRGNVQEFVVNSVSSAPVNIQLLALPSTVTSGFATEMVMVVTNNGTGVLTNIVPQITKWTSNPLPSTASCTPSATPSPPSVSTLSPGNTAIFKWDVKMVGNIGQFCTYVASLKNGFPGNNASATATLNAITATSSNWSTTWGILSINYTSLQWTQNGGTTWNGAWDVPCCINTVWQVKITNNDPTRSFVLNGNSTLVAFGTSPGSNTATQWFIIKNNYPPITGYPTNGQTIAPNSTSTIYFGSSAAGLTSGQNIGNSAKGQYAISVLIFGYWNSVAPNNFFGQNIPYEGVIVS